MPVALVTSDNELKQEDQLSEAVFACHFNEPLVHQVVTAYLAGGRQGTRAQKNRSAVSGGGKKPWKQKGMGRARAGTTRSPLWRGGGVTFAASPQDFSQKVNKKMYRSAMRSICSELLRQERFVIIDSLSLEEAKTKNLIKKLNEFDLDKRDKKILIILEQFDRNIYFAARNIPSVEVIDVEDINPVDLIDSEKILLTASTLKKIGERLS